jgi:hypothetical protein
MANRVVRGEFNASESMAARSLMAELVFVKLLLVVDDYGRCDARPRLLLSQLWPMREEVNTSDLAIWVDELASGDDPPLVIYEVEGRKFIELVNYEQHRGNSKRSSVSRFPHPPAESQPVRPLIPPDPPDPPDPRLEGSGEEGEGSVAIAPSPPPEVPKLPPKTLEAMIAVKPDGVVYSPEEIYAWFAWVIPKMRLAGKTDLVATARNWWPRVRPGEVAQGREWAGLVKARVRAAEIRDEIAEREKTTPSQFTFDDIEKAANALG